MAEYDASIAVALRLITQKGRLVTLQKMSNASTDPDKPWNGSGLPSVESQVNNVPACFVPHMGSNLGFINIDTELLKRSEQVALVAPTQEGLEVNNVVLDNSITWKINWVQVLKPGLQTVLYVFGVSR